MCWVSHSCLEMHAVCGPDRCWTYLNALDLYEVIASFKNVNRTSLQIYICKSISIVSTQCKLVPMHGHPRTLKLARILFICGYSESLCSKVKNSSPKTYELHDPWKANLPARLNLQSTGSSHSAKIHIVPEFTPRGWREISKCHQSSERLLPVSL